MDAIIATKILISVFRTEKERDDHGFFRLTLSVDK